MASGEDLELIKTLAYFKEAREHFGFEVRDFSLTECFKWKIPDWKPTSYSNKMAIIQSAGELSIEICDLLEQLCVSPSVEHMQKTFAENQVRLFRHLMRTLMGSYNIS